MGKKFQNKKEYSIKMIDKHGRGGMDLTQLTNVELLSNVNQLARIPKKLKKGKYKNSTAITLHCSDTSRVGRKIVFLSQSKSDAAYLFAGLTIIKDIVT